MVFKGKVLSLQGQSRKVWTCLKRQPHGTKPYCASSVVQVTIACYTNFAANSRLNHSSVILNHDSWPYSQCLSVLVILGSAGGPTPSTQMKEITRSLPMQMKCRVLLGID